VESSSEILRSKLRWIGAISAAESKNWEWIKKGVPVRVEIGPRDLETNSVAVSRRDHPVKSKESMSLQEFAAVVPVDADVDTMQISFNESRERRFQEEKHPT